MSARTYIVAVRRDQRDVAPDDWLDQLRAIDGISVMGSSPKRAQVQADPEALKRVREEFGTYLHIEPVIEHFPTTRDEQEIDPP